MRQINLSRALRLIMSHSTLLLFAICGNTAIATLFWLVCRLLIRIDLTR
jgi:hypothetical protein